MAFPPDAASTLSALRAKATTLIETTTDPLVLWAVVTLLAPHAPEPSYAQPRGPGAEEVTEKMTDPAPPSRPRPPAPVARPEPRPLPPPDLVAMPEETSGGDYLATPPEHDEAIWRGVVEAERGERGRPWREVMANLQMRYGEAT